MSQPAARNHGFAPGAELRPHGAGDQIVQPVDAALSAAFGHTLPTAEHISALCSKREGFGLGCVLLHFMRTRRSCLPLGALDLSEFSLGARKLKFLLSSLSSGPSPLETLTCGPGVCTPSSLPVLAAFLKRGAGGGGGGSVTCLKTIIAHNCCLNDSVLFFQSLPPSLESLDLRENRLHSPSMESLGSVLSARWIPTLLSLDLSDNPLGPFGVRALAKGLCAPLQSLRLASTDARKEGVEALAEVLKANKVSSLQTLDLAENEMRAGGFKPDWGLRGRLTVCPLPSAAAVVGAGRFPKLRVLNLAGNHMYSQEAAAFANALGEGGASHLEALDLSENGWPNVGEDGKMDGEGGAIQSLANAVSAGRVSHLSRLRLNKFFDLPNDSVRSLFQAMADGKTPDLRTIEVRLFDERDGVRFDEAVDAFALMVREGGTPQIEQIRLDFYHVDIRSAPMSSLGRALGSGRVSSLRQLKLEWFCRGDDENPEGGVVGLAEGLGGGGMPLLEDLDLDVSFGDDEEGGEGGAELGEVLSTGKAPSLRRVRLGWPATQLLSTLCEGLCVGSSPPPMMRLEMDLKDVYGNSEIPLSRLAQAIRSGRLSYLQKLSSESWHNVFRHLERSAGELGGALTHSGACMGFLEEVSITFLQKPTNDAFFGALHQGPGRLPSLRTLGTLGWHCPPASCVAPLITRGKVPSLSEVNLNLSEANIQGIQAVAMSLGSPHAASLRKMEVRFGHLAQADRPYEAATVATFCVSLASPHLTKLQSLLVSSIEDVSAVLSLCAGLESGNLSSLSELTLNDVCLETQAGALSAALDAEKLPRLSSLKLTHCSLTDEGLQALTDAWKSRQSPPLQHLGLNMNNLSDGGARTLADLLGSRKIPSLCRVNLVGNHIEGVAREMLNTAFPEFVSWIRD
uniref:Uncharacterized protein n=1 Tax=Chromera velia CCMP2878 TaxID=1169474 RepID=A0A0G4I0K2_9ALVE|eukprot:Cvel_1639.t1-p1 / transcript=Cvel_1639.t1 / gene=Cvel_1639 / organism=Chromera_velia_CCMP2878 / gene_product=Protein NLRC3, putative / transcript_product=Protein NLRC3, putative / location=Cvel_scaffold58:145288-150651(+) / protein_length=908 / sequence_SO=supercontig / SO=protein_coding / is_pseudo=false